MHRKSINVPLKQSLQRGNSGLSIVAVGRQLNSSTGYNAQGHDTKQALGIHLPAAGFNPNAAIEFVRLLNKVSSLLIVQTGLAAHNDFLFEHKYYTPYWLRVLTTRSFSESMIANYTEKSTSFRLFSTKWEVLPEFSNGNTILAFTVYTKSVGFDILILF